MPNANRVTLLHQVEGISFDRRALIKLPVQAMSAP